MCEYMRIIVNNVFDIQFLALIITIVLLSYVQILCERVVLLYTGNGDGRKNLKM